MALYRKIQNIRKRIFNNPKPLVLMYHRIATPLSDPWNLAVCPDNFQQQLQVLKETGSVISMAELLQQVEKRKLNQRYIVLTFDDGYIDNYSTAKPMLEQYQIPATFFICSKHLGVKKEYWWDELANIVLHVKVLPRILSLEINKNIITYDLNNEKILDEELDEKHHHWRYEQAPPTLRAQLYLQLWEMLSPLTYEVQQQIVNNLREWAGLEASSRSEYTCMTDEHVEQLANHNLFSIGGHSVTHPALSCHSEAMQFQEINNNKNFLETLIRTEVTSFAYPSGVYDEITIKVLKELNYKVAFTTQPRTIDGNNDPYQLGRFQVDDWTGEEFREILADWL